MKLISREVIGKEILIVTETKVLFWKKIRKFKSQGKYLPDYWKWVEMPDRLLVGDRISFQLDVWAREDAQIRLLEV